MLRKILSSFKQYIKFKPFSYLNSISWFYRDYQKLKAEKNHSFKISDEYLYPCLTDKTTNTPLDHVYFYQNAWAASKIFSYKPSRHFDIASQAGFVGIVSQFVPTTMVDIRPIDVQLNGLDFLEADILKLPIADNSLESVSSICVVEHIGLGRYGDSVDAYGSEKAIVELKRITKPGGKILFTVPIDKESRIYFNAHRAFTRQHIIEHFKDCILMEEKYIYGDRMFDEYSADKGFGTGLFYFQKN